VINHVLPQPTGPAPAYDAIAEDWFESPEAMQAAFARRQGQAVNADVPNFADSARVQIMIADDHETPPN